METDCTLLIVSGSVFQSLGAVMEKDRSPYKEVTKLKLYVGKNNQGDLQHAMNYCYGDRGVDFKVQLTPKIFFRLIKSP